MSLQSKYQILDLLRSVSDLKQAGDYLGLSSLLSEVSEEELLRKPEIGIYLVIAWKNIGRSKSALTLVEKLSRSCTRAGNESLVWRLLNLEASLRFYLGQIDEAGHLWERLLSEAAAAHNSLQVAWAVTNLGIVSDVRGRHADAITYYSRAIVAYTGLGDCLGLVRAHNNMGITYRQLGVFDKAEAHFLRALVYARDIGAEREIGLCEVERSLLHCELGDLPLAEANARNALARFETLGDPSGEGEAYRALGIIAERMGNRPSAIEHYDKALDRARQMGRKLLEAEVLEELYFVHRQGGGHEAAVVSVEGALRLYLEMGATGRVDRLVRRMTGVSPADPPDVPLPDSRAALHRELQHRLAVP